MTDENKKKAILSELAKSAEILSEATLLYENGFVSGAVSRLYYSLLHDVRALLLTKGLEPKSHEGVLRVFGLHFVKEEIFEAGASHVFSKLMKYREEADYNPSSEFDRNDFMAFRAEAAELSARINAYVREQGFL